MQELLIEQTEFSPQVNFNPAFGKFEISGESRPENTGKFYARIISWVEEFQAHLQNNAFTSPLIFEFKFDYFNSTSAKFILDFLRQLEVVQIENADLKISIHWHFDKRDEDMKESGEEFSHLVNLPFEFIAH